MRSVAVGALLALALLGCARRGASGSITVADHADSAAVPAVAGRSARRQAAPAHWDTYEGSEGLVNPPPNSQDYFWRVAGLGDGAPTDVGIASELDADDVLPQS